MQNFKYGSIANFLLSIEARYADRISHSIKVKNAWVNYTYKESIDSAFSLMKTLQTSGLKAGDKALIISRNRPEACFTFFACALAGVVAIPIDPRMSLNDLQFIYKHSGPKTIITLSGDDNLFATEIASGDKDITIIESAFNTIESKDVASAHAVNFEDAGLIIYTSGTTSRPKGVLITYNNLLSQMDTILNDTFMLKDDLRYLSILPLNHLFEFMTGMLLPFARGGEVCYGNSLLPSAVIESLKEKKIKEMVCVPLFLKMFKKGIEAKMNEKSLLRKYFKTGLFLSSFIKIRLLRKFYFLPIHLSFGGQLRRFISGGSSLDKDVEDFFVKLGFPVYQGYGLTETSPVATTNTKEKLKSGTVGTAVRGVEIKTDAISGEILIKGPNVMKGYYKDQALTDEVIRDGWFHTGDVGFIDGEGYLTITGRIKELIVLANGKKVAPHDVEEDLMRDSTILKEACVIGMKITKGSMKGIEEVCAVVVPHDNYAHIEDKIIHEMLKERLMSITDYKRPSRVVIQRKDLEKTSTLKTKRLLIKAQLEIADQNIIVDDSGTVGQPLFSMSKSNMEGNKMLSR